MEAWLNRLFKFTCHHRADHGQLDQAWRRLVKDSEIHEVAVGKTCSQKQRLFFVALSLIERFYQVDHVSSRLFRDLQRAARDAQVVSNGKLSFYH